MTDKKKEPEPTDDDKKWELREAIKSADKRGEKW